MEAVPRISTSKGWIGRDPDACTAGAAVVGGGGVIAGCGPSAAADPWMEATISAVAWAGDVSAVLLIAIRTYRLIFHPEDIHDAKVKTVE